MVNEMTDKKLKVKDLQKHYYTKDDRFYTTNEIISKPVIKGEWIPYNEYVRVLTQLIKLKNKYSKTKRDD